MRRSVISLPLGSSNGPQELLLPPEATPHLLVPFRAQPSIRGSMEITHPSRLRPRWLERVARLLAVGG